MRFEQLEYLIEISKQGSISSAAKKLHLSHQALSIAIKNLEEELGVLLFNSFRKRHLFNRRRKTNHCSHPRILL